MKNEVKEFMYGFFCGVIFTFVFWVYMIVALSGAR